MNARYFRCALFAAFAASVSACGPSKDTMCHELAADRKTAGEAPTDEVERYARCLNASDDWVRESYKEMKARQQKK